MRKFQTVAIFTAARLSLATFFHKASAIESEIYLNLESTLCLTSWLSRALFSPMFSSTKSKNSLDAGH